jgi:transcriptional/translational regulatory protein YebC/TACO1
MFAQKGSLEVSGESVSEDDLMMAVMDAGAEDIQDTGEVFEVLTSLESFEAVKQALDDSEIPFGQSSLAWIPQNYLAVAGAEADKIIRLLEGLEDLDDVQRVFSNFDIQEEDLQRLMA